MSGTNISHSLQMTMNSAVVVTMYARVISQQPNYQNVQGIPHLSQHISNCKAHSETWLDSMMPKMIKIITDVIQYAHSFKEVHDEVTIYVNELKKGDESALEEIEVLFKEVIISEMNDNVNSIRDVANQVQEYHLNYLSDLNLYQNDSGEAEQAMTKDKAEIRKKSQDLNDSQALVNQYETKLQDLVYALIGTVSASVAVPIFGIFIGGLASIGIGIAIGVLQHEYSDAVDKVSQDTIDLGNLNSDLALLKTIKNQLVNMESTIRAVRAKIYDVHQAWSTLIDFANTTLAQVKKADPSEMDQPELLAIAVMVETMMNQASSDWQETLKYAEQIKPSGEEVLHIEAESVAELLDIIKNGVPKELNK